MGLEEVIVDITKKADSDSEAILKEGKAIAAQILANAEKDIREKKAAAAADLENVKSASEKKSLQTQNSNAKSRCRT